MSDVRKLAKHWDADGSAQNCVANIVCNIDMLLPDYLKERINWHDEQSASLAVLRIVSDWVDSEAAILEKKDD